MTPSKKDVDPGTSRHLAGFRPMYVVQPLGCSPFPFPAIQQISGAPTGRRIRGGFYPGWRSAPTEPRLPWAILGCPFGAPNGLNPREKLEILPKTAFFKRILFLKVPNQGQPYRKNQNHLMNCAAETSRFILSTIYYKASYLFAP